MILPFSCFVVCVVFKKSSLPLHRGSGGVTGALETAETGSLEPGSQLEWQLLSLAAFCF